MSYCIVSQPRAWWPVIFPGVTEDGQVIENRFELRFFIHDEDRALELAKEADEYDTAREDLALSEKAALFAEKLASDWRDVLAENKEPLPWNSENLRLLVKQPGVFKAICRAWISCRNATPEIRQGN